MRLPICLEGLKHCFRLTYLQARGRGLMNGVPTTAARLPLGLL
jgi:hypothetical protein